MVRVYITCLLLWATGLQLHAQSDNYRLFEWDLLQLGYASPGGGLYSGGFMLGTEFRFNITDNISAGLNTELAAFGSAIDNELISVGITAGTSLTGDYYFVDDKSVRPFAGFGFGRYFGGNFSDDTDIETISVENSWGIAPRVGVELGHFRVALEYTNTLGGGVPSYFCVSIAPTLFGGLK